MPKNSAMLTRLHRLGPGLKAFLAGIMGIGYLAAVAGLIATALSGIGLSGLGFGLTGTSPNYGPLLLGLFIFYVGCIGQALLNTGIRQSLRVALTGLFSAVLTLPILGVFTGAIANTIYRNNCFTCQFFSGFLASLWTWLPAVVPAIVILALSIPMSQARWRGMGVGLLFSVLLGSAFSAVLAYWGTRQTSAIGPVTFSQAQGVLFWVGPLVWALITYGTLRVKGNPDGEHLARIRSG